MPTRVTEAEMADVVKAILAERPTQSATFAELREIVPTRIHLSRSDRRASVSRPSEQVWMQILRNLASHIDGHGEFVLVQGGLRLEWRVKQTEKPDGGNGRRAVAAKLKSK